MSDTNLSLYRIFDAVVQAGSISGAAKTLYISQPAVSHAIAQLEEGCGCRLFSRNARGVTLTEEGQILHRHVSEAFRVLSAGESELRAYHDLGIGHLTFGASTTLCRYRLLPCLKDFVRSNPHISIDISCQPTIQTLSLLESGAIDIGLVARQKHMKGMGFISLGEIEDIFVAAPEYLDRLRERLQASDDSSGSSENDDMGRELLNAGTLLLLDKGNATRQYIDHYLEENHIHAANTIEITTMDLLIEFARTGLGIAGLIKEFVLDDLKDGSLTQIPIGSSLSRREIGFAWVKKPENHQAMERFLKFVG